MTLEETLISLARPAVQKLEAYRSARSLVTKGEVFLDANENPWPPFPGDSSAEGVNRYPEPQPKSLSAKLAELYQVQPSQLLMGRGADEAIDILVRTFCEAGRDNILICPPTYGVYAIAAQIQGAGVIEVPVHPEEGFLIQVEEVIAGLKQNVKLVFLCHPNNPTGNLIPRESIRRILSAAASKAIVVVDEAYIEFSDCPSFVDELDQFPNLVVLRTLSKAWSLAGARCGVAIAHPTLIGLMQKIRAPYPFSLPAVQVIERAISSEGRRVCQKRIQHLNESRIKMGRDLAALPQVERVFPSEGNFLLVKTKSNAAFLDLCLHQGIIIRSRSRDLGLCNCVRVTIGSDAENARLLEVLKEYALA